MDSKRASHPPLRHRMEAFQVNTLDILPFTKYDNEEVNEAIRSMINDMDANATEYNFAYEHYQKQFEIIEEYKAYPDETIKAKLAFAVALYDTGSIEESYEVFKAIIEEDESIAEAQYYVGLIELSYYDDETGVNRIYKAFELQPSQIQILENIVVFAIKMGRQDLLDKNRKYMIDKTQDSINQGIDLLHYIDHKTKIKPVVLDETLLNQIKHISKEHNFLEVYAVEKKLTKSTKSILILVFSDYLSTNFISSLSFVVLGDFPKEDKHRLSKRLVFPLAFFPTNTFKPLFRETTCSS